MEKKTLKEYMDDKLFRHSYCLVGHEDVELAKEIIQENELFNRYKIETERSCRVFSKITLIGKGVYES